MNKTRAHRGPRLGVIAALLLPLAGCGLEAAILGASVSAAQSGVTLFERRKIRSFEFAMFDDVHLACRASAEAMSLKLLNERVDEDDIWLYYRYQETGKIVVQIHRRTPTVTTVVVEVRSTTERGMGSLFLGQMYVELERADAYLQDWSNLKREGATSD